MELYDENELQASIEEGERRLAQARQRKRRWTKLRWVYAGALLLGAAFFVAAGVAAGRAPEAPLLVATWPKPKIKQVFASGQTLLFRAGQPFDLSVVGAENWNIVWVVNGIESESQEFSWSPTSSAETVSARCRPVAHDWTGFFSFLWPTREVSLKSVVAPRVGDYGRELQAGNDGVWVYPHIFAAGHVAWDERALSRLVDVTPAPQLETGALDEAKNQPSKFAWRVVSDFEGYSSKPSESGTFASLQAPNLESALPEIAAKIVKIAPEASVKFILRLDKSPAEGIVRLAYDGKQERKAWIRRAGEAAGAPFTGWEDGDLNDEAGLNFAPTLPR